MHSRYIGMEVRREVGESGNKSNGDENNNDHTCLHTHQVTIVSIMIFLTSSTRSQLQMSSSRS